jgi:cell division protein FtsI (penicillin-binding protein 3)
MKENEESTLDFRSVNRLKLIVFFFALLFLIIFVRLFYIQVLNSEKYRKLAEAQHLRKIEIKAKRGEIYDRNGILLASTIDSRSFAIDPLVLKQDSTIFKQFVFFAKMLGIDSNRLGSYLNTNKKFLWLRRGLVDYPRWLDTFSFPGLIQLTEPKRIYMYGSIVSNLLGLVNIDNKGISGIEYSLDSILQGKDGYTYFLRDARGRLIPSIELPSQSPQNGRSVKLAIDINLQKIVSYFLREGIVSTGAKGGCVIAINPKNGEILALANYPSFNPDSLTQLDISFQNLYAIHFAFEPGSTIKPLVAAIAMDRGIVDDETLFDGYNGKFVYGDVQIYDEHPFSKLRLREALVYSSNVAFAQVSTLVPPDIMVDNLLKLGLGNRTGIELPAEVKGYVKRGDTLSFSQRLFLGFGYGLFVSPIQLAFAFTPLANDGVMVKPKLFHKDSSDISTDTIFKKSTVERLKQMLIKVVDEGTAVATKVDGVKIAGKTGTAQKYIAGGYSKSSYVNTFVGFLPAENPKLLILVLLDEPKTSVYAGATAVPIFRKIVLSILNSKLAGYILN